VDVFFKASPNAALKAIPGAAAGSTIARIRCNLTDNLMNLPFPTPRLGFLQLIRKKTAPRRLGDAEKNVKRIGITSAGSIDRPTNLTHCGVTMWTSMTTLPKNYHRRRFRHYPARLSGLR
jgi:hypothetical protein